VTAVAEDAQTFAEFVSLARYDWLVSKSWNRLHWADLSGLSSEDKQATADYWGVSVPVRLACGRTAASLWIPGIFSRMGAPRCAGCCRALGYPAGIGSPKNSDGCRKMLGLPVAGSAA
jgi:hypothetical protein